MANDGKIPGNFFMEKMVCASTNPTNLMLHVPCSHIGNPSHAVYCGQCGFKLVKLPPAEPPFPLEVIYR